MERRQSAGHIHHEHRAKPECSTSARRAVESSVESLNDTRVGLRAIGLGEVMQGRQRARCVEGKDSSASERTPARRRAVDEAIGASNQPAKWALSIEAAGEGMARFPCEPIRGWVRDQLKDPSRCCGWYQRAE